MPLIIVTGPIGAGKSSFARCLADLGADLLAADDVVRGLYESDPELVQEVGRVTARRVVATDGALDRAALAEIIFQDEAARQRVERLVHPRVDEQVERWLAAGVDGWRVFETPIWRPVSRSFGARTVVKVDAPEPLRVARLVARGMAESDALARIRTQALDPSGPVDRIIVNDGSVEQLREMAAHLLAELGEIA